MHIERRLAFAQEYQQDVAAFLQSTTSGAKPARKIPNSEDILLLKSLEDSASQDILTDDEIDLGIGHANKLGITSRLGSHARMVVRHKTGLLTIRDELRKVYETKRDGPPLKDKITVFWGHPYEYNGEKVSGIYYTDQDGNGVILIDAHKPEDDQVLSSLAKNGRLPAPLETETHEKIHGMQFKLIIPRSIPQEFIEAQAYRTNGTTFAEEPHEHIVNFVVNSPLYEGVNERRFHSALWTVDRFNALGFSQEQIVRATNSPGEWDNANGVWVGLDTRLQREMHKRGMNSEALERKVIEYDLRKATSIRRARTSTQNVIYERFRDEIDRRRGRARRLRRDTNATQLQPAGI